MNFYTIVLEYAGGTYYSQVMSTTPRGAALKWIKSFDFKGQLHMRRVNVPDIIDYQIKQAPPFLMPETINVWCFGFILKRKLAYGTIVKTRRK